MIQSLGFMILIAASTPLLHSHRTFNDFDPPAPCQRTPPVQIFYLFDQLERHGVLLLRMFIPAARYANGPPTLWRGARS
jgi:hypothetical protein